MKNNMLFKVLIVTFLMSLSITNVHAETEWYYENNYGVQFSKEKYDLFLEAGFSEEEIINMSEETYESYAYMDHVKLDKSETKYFRDTNIYGYGVSETITEEISEFEYNNEIESYVIQNLPLTRSVSHETTYKKLVVNSTQISYAYPNKRLVSALLTWKKIPATKSYDIFAARTVNGEISTDSYSGTMTSTETSFDSACVWNGTKDYTTTYNNVINSGAWNIYKANDFTLGYNGVGFTGLLKNHSAVCNSDLGLLFSEVKEYKSTLSFQALTGTTVYVSYQHAQSSVSFNSVKNAYSYSNSGLGNVIYFSNSTIRGYYDGMGGVSLTL